MNPKKIQEWKKGRVYTPKDFYFLWNRNTWTII